MTNLNETVASTLNYTVRSLISNLPCKTSDCLNCTTYLRNNITFQEIQECLLNKPEESCLLSIQKSIDENLTKSNWCPIYWDGITCWPATSPGEIRTIPCQNYVLNFNYSANATKHCLTDGTWYLNEKNDSWANYTECKNRGPFDYLLPHLNNYYLITAVGYTVSLITLLVAFCIFTFNKRLRSPKNNLHIKLFMSFILRCVLFHIKRLNAFQDDLPTLNTSTNSTDLILSNVTNNGLICKIFTILWQFSLLANYNWILMEAVYLQSLISFNTFTDNSSIIRYAIFGWTVPALIMIPWSLAKYYYENNECWITIDNTYIFWMFIKGPITLSIVLSFAIFVNVIRILYLKIFSSGLPNQINYCKYSKWFRSTLVLVPLFGVHHTLLLSFKLLIPNENTGIILFYFDVTFTSFQGFFVALLYCFFSSEVLMELRKTFRRFKARKANYSLRRPSRITSNTFNSVLTQSIKQKPDKQIVDNGLGNGLSSKSVLLNGPIEMSADKSIDTTVKQQDKSLNKQLNSDLETDLKRQIDIVNNNIGNDDLNIKINDKKDRSDE